MATIPIEVIVQDKASPEPTPTPSDSGETNIVVPDTGAGTINNASNGGGIGSVVSIILPAITLVLAIGTIVAILVHRYQKRKKTNDGIKEYDTKESKRTVNRKEKLSTVASGTIAILAATVLVGNLAIPVTKAATSVEPGTAELDTVDKITITATREIDSDITIATVKNTSYATANLDFGYKVTASMTENATTANLYLNGDETGEYYIAPVSDGTLADNTWGYTLEEPSEDTTYLPIPLVDTPATITKGNDMVEDEAVDIYYAIKVDKDMPAGSYIGELEYNISEQNPIDSLTYMQDFATMTEEEKTATLASMSEGEQYILKDIRDEKPYYISKLADGNVWMTQNLDHDIVSTPNFYTSDNTDLPNGTTWTGVATKTSSDMTWSGSSTTPESYDPGIRYWDGVVNDSWGGSIDSNTTTTGNSHYHIGNYYNWTASIASNDSSPYDSSQEVVQSICPAGWKLPGINEGESYLDVVELYNLSSGVNGDIQKEPAYYVYSSQWTGSKDNETGNFGYLWTNKVSYSDGSAAFKFDFFGGKGLNDYDNRRIGFSIRCLVR